MSRRQDDGEWRGSNQCCCLLLPRHLCPAICPCALSSLPSPPCRSDRLCLSPTALSLLVAARKSQEEEEAVQAEKQRCGLSALQSL
jgi:hypothetical protein